MNFNRQLMSCDRSRMRLGRDPRKLLLRENMMRKLNVIVAVTMIALTAPALAMTDGSPEWLFVHTADEVEMEEEGVLVVPVDREIFAFTDRPYRQHHYINAHEFISLWNGSQDSFENDPPNAVLTWLADGEVHEAEVELVDAAVADYGRNIVYRIDLESGIVLPEEARRVSLFVDGMSAAEFCATANLDCSGS